jgi:hypothetical protein
MQKIEGVSGAMHCKVALVGLLKIEARRRRMSIPALEKTARVIKNL